MYVICTYLLSYLVLQYGNGTEHKCVMSVLSCAVHLIRNKGCDACNLIKCIFNLINYELDVTNHYEYPL